MSEEVMRHGMLLKGTEFFHKLQIFRAISVP